MIGHNQGPSLEPGQIFRRVAWRKARTQLLPTLPIEILRRRVARAKTLGLPYKTYASVRAASGHDVVAFLFSNNALHMLRKGDQPDPERHAQLVKATPIALAHPPILPEDLPFEIATKAPGLAQSWSVSRDHLRAAILVSRLPRDGVLVIAETELEKDWCAMAGLAGTVPADSLDRPTL
ncbi:hypothetical protein [Cognatishimia sp. MH4019]|uniref:hypothetical protein n=1 Tax=Cognatishimia sp. MH4019 TaxID=2854030 RepID=UPI001CD32630|nr:hypothetical protein [Cognatishimia sp. MH4019]